MSPKTRYKSEKFAKIDAEKLAKAIGCSGAHQNEKGQWMPCASPEKLQAISTEAEPPKKPKGFYDKGFDEKSAKPKRKKRGKRKRYVADGWEKLRERKPLGIDSLPDGKLVSGNNPPLPGVGETVTAFGGGIIPPITNMGSKSLEEQDSKRLIGPEYVRDNDPDVFIDPESARFRSRQLGCIGISRRISKSGRGVWMPCSNMSDYSRLAGTTHLGRMRKRQQEENRIRNIVSRDLKNRKR